MLTVPSAVWSPLVALIVHVPALPMVNTAVPLLVLVSTVLPSVAVTVEPLSTVTVIVDWNFYHKQKTLL